MRQVRAAAVIVLTAWAVTAASVAAAAGEHDSGPLGAVGAPAGAQRTASLAVGTGDGTPLAERWDGMRWALVPVPA